MRLRIQEEGADKSMIKTAMKNDGMGALIVGCRNAVRSFWPGLPAGLALSGGHELVWRDRDRPPLGGKQPVLGHSRL